MDDIDSTIVRVLEERGDTVGDEQLAMLTPNLSTSERVEAVNRLLSAGRVELLSGGATGKFSLRLRQSVQLPTCSTEEQLVFSLIEDSQKAGIWIRDIRDRSGLSQAQMRKALKALEQRKLVKAIKAVSSTKKCYMLFDLQPDEALSGGTFYSDQQLDGQFVQTLVQLCNVFLQSRSVEAERNFPNDPNAQREMANVSSTAVWEYVRDRGVLRVTLSVADIEAALQVTILDGNVESCGPGMYRWRRRSRRLCPLAALPCLQCPLINDCRSGNAISPENCVYFSDWLIGNQQ